MTLTLTATPAPDRACIDLRVDAGAAGSRLLELTRQDANGSAPVRLPVLPSTIQAFTTADYEAALAGLVEYEAAVQTGAVVVERVNLFTRSSYYAQGSNAVSSQVAAGGDGPDGRSYSRATLPAPAGSWWRLRADTNTPITPGEAYTVSAWVRSSSARGVWVNWSWAGISEFRSPVVMLEPNVWTRIHGTAVAPAGSTLLGWIALMTDGVGTAAGDTLDAAPALIEQASIMLPDFDGARMPAGADPSQRVRWTGTAGSSTSELYTPAGAELRARVAVDMDGLIAPRTWHLHPAVLPQDGVTATFVDWNLTRSRASVVSEVINRADPIVNRGVLGLRRGTIELHAPDASAVAALETLAEQLETLMIRQTDFPGFDGYFEIESVAPRIRRETARTGAVEWWVTLTVAEVTRPGGPLLAPTSWTYAAALATYGTYRAARRALPTYRDLLIGVAS